MLLRCEWLTVDCKSSNVQIILLSVTRCSAVAEKAPCIRVGVRARDWVELHVWIRPGLRAGPGLWSWIGYGLRSELGFQTQLRSGSELWPWPWPWLHFNSDLDSDLDSDPNADVHSGLSLGPDQSPGWIQTRIRTRTLPQMNGAFSGIAKHFVMHNVE